MEEFDCIVIGSGPGGYVAAIKAAQLGLKTACVERYPTLGGTCLNVGCIPSKALLHSSEHFYSLKNHGKDLGINFSNLQVDLKQMMSRKSSIVSGFNQGIAGLLKKNKVVHVQGHGKFISSNEIEVLNSESNSETKKLSAKNFIIATGSKPTELPFLPFDKEKVVSSTEMLSLKNIPEKLLVIGAGVIGVELGSVYNRIGANVEFIEFMDRVCPTLDESVSKGFQKLLEKQGMKFNLSTKVLGGEVSSSGVKIEADSAGKKGVYEGDMVLVSVGRRPYSDNLGLDQIGLDLDPKGYIPINDAFQTKIPHIYAIGDVVDGPMLAHKAEEEGMAAAEIIAGHSPKIEYMSIPSVVYTSPEVACVGLTEEEAKEHSLTYKTAQFPFKANSRARCIGDDDGFVKVITDKASSQLLGMHILGPCASELIQEASVAITNKLTAKQVIESSHAHPTLSEAIKEALLAVESKAIHI